MSVDLDCGGAIACQLDGVDGFVGSLVGDAPLR